jgi:hypothetical protein
MSGASTSVQAGGVYTPSIFTDNYFYANGTPVSFGGGGSDADFSEVAEDILPLFSEVYDIGSANKRWYDVYVGNNLDINGATLTGADGVLSTTSDVVVGSLLSDQLLLSDNMITPDSSTALQYLGDQGVVVVNGNMDVQGDWLKVAVVQSANVATTVNSPAAWTSGSNMNAARFSLAGAGTQSAGLGFGGFSTSGRAAATEEYDGAAWSSGGNLGTARTTLAGAGTQTAGLAFGGDNSSFQITAATEEYDGTSWSSGGNLGTSRDNLAGAGTQSAGLAFGGYNSSFQITAATEEYDGTSWTSGGNLGTSRDNLAGAGSQSAGLAFGGYNSSFQITAATEEYDGTSWTSGGSLATARYALAGAGSQSAGLAFGGQNSSFQNTAATEEYDGSTWTTGGALGTARLSLAGAGTQSAGLGFGGYTNTRVATTEEYTGGGIQEIVTTIPPLTTGEAGLIRYNQDVDSFEGHNGVEWGAIGGGGTTYTAGTGINITDDVISATAPPLTYATLTATGDGVTATFTIASGRTVHDILVFVNGLCFTPTDDYTISGSTLTFTEAPSNLAEITFRFLPI